MLRRVSDRLQRAAGLDRDRVVVGINVANPVHPPRVQHDRVAVRRWRGPPGQTRIASLRDDGRGVARTGQHDGCGFARRRREHDGIGAPREALAPIRTKGSHVGRNGQHVAWADRLGQLCDQGRHDKVQCGRLY